MQWSIEHTDRFWAEMFHNRDFKNQKVDLFENYAIVAMQSDNIM